MEFKYNQATLGETYRFFHALNDQSANKFSNYTFTILTAIESALMKEDTFLFNLNAYAACYRIWRTTEDQEKRKFFFNAQEILCNELKLDIFRQLPDEETRNAYRYDKNLVYEYLTVLCLSYFVDHLYPDND